MWKLCPKCKHMVKFWHGDCENCGHVPAEVIIRSSDNSGPVKIPYNKQPNW